MMTPAAAPANKTAQGLARPMSRETSAGKPKIPLPIIELITSAARLHRPIARTSPDCFLPGKTWLYHRTQPSASAVSFQRGEMWARASRSSIGHSRDANGKWLQARLFRDPDERGV